LTASTVTAVDTSVAVPLLMSSHHAHPVIAAWAMGRSLGLSGHALAETYSVLTRLPGDARARSTYEAVRAAVEPFIGVGPG
jgi:toxin FitB